MIYIVGLAFMGFASIVIVFFTENGPRRYALFLALVGSVFLISAYGVYSNFVRTEGLWTAFGIWVVLGSAAILVHFRRKGDAPPEKIQTAKTIFWIGLAMTAIGLGLWGVNNLLSLYEVSPTS